MSKCDYHEIKNILDSGEVIVISSHVAPDGDNIGSMLGLGLSLISAGKSVFMINQDEVPSDYMFLKGVEKILKYEDIEDFDSINPDAVILLDTSSIERVGKKLEDVYNNISCPIINIDHHRTNTNFGAVNCVEHTSATGELVYKIITNLGLPMNKEIASAIYVAINTDTGRFQYDSVDSNTHVIAANLISLGVEAGKINTELYQNISIKRQTLHNKVLGNTEYYEDNKIAVALVTLDLMKETDTKTEDTEGLVETLRNIAPVEVAVLIKEKACGEYKISIRTKSYADASVICSKFNGGGHIKAAGCTIFSDLNNAKNLIIKAVKDEINEKRCSGN
ncbi:MAG: bifunctional oligoribonuclease/PAP phosphatase NrnA [Tissierellia bacterium]|nr:bifunctional oligoribonuclease/PAP phosphatase NrnA [Tissierellia bacterium]